MVCIALFLCFFGCGSEQAAISETAENSTTVTTTVNVGIDSTTRSDGLSYPVNGLPQVCEFSGDGYEDYELRFPKVEGAHSGKLNMDADDAYTFKILNFFAYSRNNSLDIQSETSLAVSETDQILKDDNYLEIWFEDPSEIKTGDVIERAKKIVVYADRYFVFVEEIDGMNVYEVYPYKQLLLSMVRAGEYPESVLDKAWILLESYVGNYWNTEY